jgi:hypothetical protein
MRREAGVGSAAAAAAAPEKATHEEPAIEGLTSSALNSIMGCPALGRVCPTRRALGGSRLLVLVLLVLGGLGCGGGGWRGLRSVALGGRGRGGVGVDGHRRGERKKVRLE